ncbi:probable cytochrome P450 305a1 [Chironomus tepperi]|uniref:probable cytochrome P450 305a1 n=1 Tax=Chironomus tepperi TaxID=113505 RepID=UPI00391F69E9
MEIATILILTVLLMVVLNKFRRPNNYPPGPTWLVPFVGNSPYLRKLSRKLGGQHKAFEFLSKELKSPVFSLKLGTENVVVGMTHSIAKEIYSREEFDARPDNFFIRLRTMGTRLGITCTEGKYWTEQRSFVLRQLRNIGYGKTLMHEKIAEELKEVLDIIKNTNGQPIWPGGSNIISTSVVNILWTFTTGTKIKRNDKRLAKFFELLQKRSKAFDVSGGYLSQMPWLRFIAPEATGYNLINDLNSKFYAFFMEFVDEHLRTYSDDKSNNDLIYAFLKEMKEREGQTDSTFTIKQLIMVILDIFIGGSQTTSTAIDLTLMTMIIYPDIQRKCHEELENVVGTDGVLPSFADRHRTPYIDAVINEVHRFYSLLVVGGPRRALKDCHLQDYFIPKGTTVFIGLGDAQHDEAVWDDPHTFNPERFFNEKMHKQFFPFGAGRRKCLGDQLAKECIYKFFTGILDKFTLHKSDKEEDAPSMDLLPGIILSPKPYKIVFKQKSPKIM